jgi:hypothetical protein
MALRDTYVKRQRWPRLAVFLPLRKDIRSGHFDCHRDIRSSKLCESVIQRYNRKYYLVTQR